MAEYEIWGIPDVLSTSWELIVGPLLLGPSTTSAPAPSNELETISSAPCSAVLESRFESNHSNLQ